MPTTTESKGLDAYRALLAQLKQCAANDPEPFMQKLWGENVRACGESRWRCGQKQGRELDTLSGELLCCDYSGGDEKGDIFQVWMSVTGDTFKEAVVGISELYADALVAGVEVLPREQRPRVDVATKEARTMERPAQWKIADRRHHEFMRGACHRLANSPELQREIASKRGWPLPMIRPLALTGYIGMDDFNLWGDQRRFTPPAVAVFPVFHPAQTVEQDGSRFTSWRLVQIHARLLASAAQDWNGRHRDWLYSPTLKMAGAEDGTHCPLVISRQQRDPEQPGLHSRCRCVVLCAGQWDALTLLLATGWFTDAGEVFMPRGLAFVGIRGEGRGGTDAYLRHFRHWRPESAILLADADKTGATWSCATDGRPCFAQQLRDRGAEVLSLRANSEKDINDEYRAGRLGKGDVTALLEAVGFDWKGH